MRERDEVQQFIVRWRPRVWVLLPILIMLLAWLNVPGRPDL